MFRDNLDAFTRALGVENAPLIVALSEVPWAGPDERNQFILDLTGKDVGDDSRG